nr:MAG: ORF1 [Torque teno midi virus]
MPFWWQRRKRWWRGRRRPYYKRRTTYRRKRKPYRRRHRATYRRRRRRRTKVKKKRKTIAIKQWQPDHIRKCKIKGYLVNVLGGEGRQFVCYTDSKYDWTLPTAPGGGGFGVEKFTLQFLYSENKMGKNIWTTSNTTLDLCRYTGTKIVFFRHPHVDFVGFYSRNYPMTLEKYTYAFSHPAHILLKKHHFIIPSMATKPRGKRTVKIKIKPPKQLSTKWFFQEAFAEQGLFVLTVAACDLRYPHLGYSSSNQLVNLYLLNTQFYQKGGWGNATVSTSGYIPYPNAVGGTYQGTDYQGKQLTATVSKNTYNESVSYGKGYFQTKLLQMVKMTSPSQVPPTAVTRYNPTIDKGTGNMVWIADILNTSYGPPSTDKTLILQDLPLWQLMYGMLSYITKTKGDKYFLRTHVLLFKSPYCEPQNGPNHYFMPIDKTFINGQFAYGRFGLHPETELWFPTVVNQLESINDIVQAGPFIPKLDNTRQSTWECYCKYTVFFKWGGADQPDATAADPSKQATYEVPDKVQQAVQILNPAKNKAAKMLHAWDYRRGLITRSALKRMYEDSETDTSFQISTDSQETPKKRRMYSSGLPLQEQKESQIQTCLLSLCESNSYQEEEETQENLLQLIKQQQQKQHKLRDNLLQLIANIKQQQTVLQLQTGLLG